MPVSWAPDLPRRTDAYHSQPPAYDDAIAEQFSSLQTNSSFPGDIEPDTQHHWPSSQLSAKGSISQEQVDEDRFAARSLWATPRPAQAFEQALADNFARTGMQRPFVGQPSSNTSNWYYETDDDTWLPEPPLAQPTTSGESPWSFLDLYPRGNATITYNGEHGNLLAIHNLNIDIISIYAPIIAASFEHSDRDMRLHLEVLTKAAALPFLRFAYTGSYNDGQHYDDVPTSLLLHSQLHFIATIFDMPDLRREAWVNVKRQCEFACASPQQPIDLVAALRYCYTHVDSNKRIIDDIIDYCIERYYPHKLKADADFVLLTKEQQFCSDLAKGCGRRNFEDESALDIIRLQSNQESFPQFASYEDPTNRRCLDMMHHLSQGAPAASNTTMANPTMVSDHAADHGSDLAIRTKQMVLSDDEDITSSEDEGFKVVRPARSESGASTPTDSEFVLVVRTREQQQAPSSIAEATDSDSEWTLA